MAIQNSCALIIAIHVFILICFVEDIHSWVDVNTLKKKQAEELEKRDYMNVPNITVTDSEGDTSPPIQNSNNQSDERLHNNAPPPPVNARPRSASDTISDQPFGKAPPPPSNSRPKSTSEDVTDQSNSVVQSATRSKSIPNGNVTNIDKHDASAEEKKSGIQTNDIQDLSKGKAEETDFEHPEHIANILQSIRKKRINRIYTSEKGELVIQFANPDDAASFGICDIRETSCPVTEPTSENNPPSKPEVPCYSTVNKQRVSGQYDNIDRKGPEAKVEPTKTCNNAKNQSDSSSDIGTPKMSKSKPKTDKKLKKLPKLDDEFAIFV